jgi:hypothetical protein
MKVNSAKMIRLVLASFMLIIGVESETFAQCSVCPLNETWGSSATCPTTQGSSGSGIVNHSLEAYTSGGAGDAPGDGSYSIRCDADELLYGWYGGGGTTIADNTADASGVGYFAVINAGAGKTEFYHQNLTNLCSNTSYTVSFAAGNIARDDGWAPNYPNISAYVYPGSTAVTGTNGFSTAPAGGTLLGSTGSMTTAVGGTSMVWNAYSYTFTTGAGQTAIDLILTNISGNNAGFDFAIDDIKVTKTSGGGSCTTTPVELISFTAENGPENVLLNWSTATEKNNDYFTVQKSKNGIDFIGIENIKGAGTSQQQLNYHTTDPYPYAGISYYRLKQVDYDGKFSHSKIVVVKNEETQISIYPNPSQGSFKLSVINERQPYSIEVTDVEGRLVYKGSGNPDNQVTEISGLSKGIYVVRIIDGSMVTLRKLVVI